MELYLRATGRQLPYMGSQVNTPALTIQPDKPVLDLPTPEGWKTELTYTVGGAVHTEMVYLIPVSQSVKTTIQVVDRTRLKVDELPYNGSKPMRNFLLLSIPTTFLCSSFLFLTSSRRNTRKLSYRKDDRAVRPIYKLQSLSTSTANFPEFFNGFLFRLIL